MALVLSERDYKRVTVFAKMTSVFVFAAGTIVLVDHGQVLLSIFLVVLGSAIMLAPLPMSVVRPEGYDEADDGMLVVERDV